MRRASSYGPAATALRQSCRGAVGANIPVHADDFDRIPFFCECSDESCYQPLWLTLDEYDRLIEGDTFGLAPGHTRPRRSRRAVDAVAETVGVAA